MLRTEGFDLGLGAPKSHMSHGQHPLQGDYIGIIWCGLKKYLHCGHIFLEYLE